MDKIEMTTPIVEMDGDEMAGILWKEVKRQLVEPFVELKEEYYDLSIRSRDATEDQVTIDSALATKKYGVAVKCATITANLERMQEFNLKKMYKSPNATIRSILDGTVFRTPILIDGIDLKLSLDEARCSVEIVASVSCAGRTGVEMEALTAAATAALTVYDMCKAVQKDMVITDLRLLRKSGGVHGDFERSENDG